MSRATPELRKFAERLIAYETRADSPKTAEGQAFRVGAKLRPHLATLMGSAGFRALVSRALALASAEVPALKVVRVKTDGTFDGWDELAAEVRAEEIAKGRVVVVTQLLGLLAAFIGENLTVRLVLEAWPKLPLQGLTFGDGAKDEKTK
jgi:hypothetical protein